MSGEWKIRLAADVTAVPNRFIDEYMTMADGEDVKVFLYFLRHAAEGASPEDAARDLRMSAKEIRRALRIWKRAGIMEPAGGEDAAPEETDPAPAMPESVTLSDSVPAGDESSPAAPAGKVPVISVPAAAAPEEPEEEPVKAKPRVVDLELLEGDEDFAQLLYIGERYLNKTFNPREVETLGYLYSTVGMSGDLLEYVIEYCAQNSHNSLRYVEKVALAWHDSGIVSVEEAKAFSGNYTADMFAAMKAMGLSGRNPGESEKKYLEKWFRKWGFSREMVVEACSRTIERIHKPSFQYADGILSGWKKDGITTSAQVEEEDRRHDESLRAQAEAGEQEERDAAGRTAVSRGQRTARKSRTAKPATRFHNLEEHGYDYDEMVWSMVAAPPKKPGGDNGAE